MINMEVPEYSSNAIHILHLSDIHFNEKRFGVRREILNREFFRTVGEHIKRYDMKPDLILIAGDIAYRGQKEEYEEAIRFLHKLEEMIHNTDLMIFPVPGNHDVNRNAKASSAEASDDPQGMPLGPNQSQFDAYQKFLETAKLMLKRADAKQSSSVYQLRELNLLDWPVVIMEVNSALFSHGQGSDSEEGLSNYDLPSVGQMFPILKLEPSKRRIVILLQHHPLSPSDLSKSNLTRILIENDTIIFHGHLHPGKGALKPNGEKVIQLGLGEGYIPSFRPNDFGFQFVTIDPAEGECHVFPYRFRGDTFSVPAEGSEELAKRGYISFRFREPLGQEKKMGSEAPASKKITIRKVLDELHLAPADEEKFRNLIGVAAKINELRNDEARRDRLTRTSLIFTLLYLNETFWQIMLQCGIDRGRFRKELALTGEIPSWRLPREDVEIDPEMASALGLAPKLLGGRPLGNLELAYLILESCRQPKLTGALRPYLKKAKVNINYVIDLLRREIESPASAPPPSPPPLPRVSPPDRAAFDSDAVVRKGLRKLDRLNMREQAEMFAKVLAARGKDLTPLSLGLFGDWGTGKSFFMRLMREEIEELVRMQGEDPKLPYIHRVCQIEFNAWHYIDSQLWASLATHIFTELAKEISGANQGPTPDESEVLKTRRKLHAQVASSEEAKKQAQLDQEKAKGLLQTAEAEKQFYETQLDSQRSKFKAGRADRDKIVRSLQTTGAKLTDDKELAKVNDALHSLGLADQAGTVGEFRKLFGQVEELGRIWKKLRASSSELWALRKDWRYLAGVIAFVVILEALYLWFPTFRELNADLRVWICRLAPPFLSFAGLFLAQLKRIYSAFNLLQEVTQGLQGSEDGLSLREAGEPEEIEKRQRAALEPSVAKINELEAKVREQEEAIKNADQMIAKAGQEIQRIESGGLVYDFLLERACASPYREHLGLISTIRQDFERMGQLLEDWEKNAQKEKAANAPKGEPEKPKFPIERIILYIDDLDRCPPKKVVDVLQAVHLLLAFDLFVVVVGVDSRWLQRSLNEEYNRPMLFPEAGEGKAAEEEREKWHRFDACNYLEKIFQIPFSLAAMSDEGFVAMIDGLVEPEPKAPEKADIDEAGLAEEEKEAAKGMREQAPAGPEFPATIETDVSRNQPPAGTLPDAAPPAREPSGQGQPPIPESGTVKPSTKESAPVPADHAQALLLHPNEKEYMKKLAGFIGTPRMTKRFVNIYRLLRVRADKIGGFEQFIDAKKGENRAALILLAINLGSPALGPKLLRILASPPLKADEGLDFSKLLDWLTKVKVGDEKLGKVSLWGRYWVLSPEEFKEAVKVHADYLDLVKTGTAVPDTIAPYIRWAPEVGRYSYEWRLGGE
jgi:predicted MPP superfamily phosphohydrolase